MQQQINFKVKTDRMTISPSLSPTATSVRIEFRVIAEACPLSRILRQFRPFPAHTSRRDGTTPCP